MKTTLQIKVEKPLHLPSEPFKKVFDNRVEIDDNVCVPYTQLLLSLKFMYGNDSLVTFCIW